LIISSDTFVPYKRPPLSKELWFSSKEERRKLKYNDWEGNPQEYSTKEFYLNVLDHLFILLCSLFFLPESMYDVVHDEDTTISPLSKVKIILQHKAQRIDRREHVVYLDDGREIKYGKVLIATGGEPKKIPEVDHLPSELKARVTTYRTVCIFVFDLQSRYLCIFTGKGL
jgi:apoptosis-inducing factor 1